MELTVLGCWAPYPAAGGACPGYLLKVAQRYLMLDCGNGTLGKLQEHIDFRGLEAVIISHLHPDHYLDLFSLRHAIEGSLRDGSRKDKLKVFLPSQPRETFIELYKFKTAFDLIPIETLTRGESIKDEIILEYQVEGEYRVKFFPTKHPILTYSVVIEEFMDNLKEDLKQDLKEDFNKSLKKVAYSADTGYKSSLVEFWEKADLLLIEASLQEQHKEMTKLGHLTAQEAGQLAKEAQVKRVLLTHFWPKFNLQVTAQEAGAGFGSQVELAQTGRTFSIK